MRQHCGSNASIDVIFLYLMFRFLQIVLYITYQCNKSVTIESYDSTTRFLKRVENFPPFRRVLFYKQLYCTLFT